jgi:hypothetical protein
MLIFILSKFNAVGEGHNPLNETKPVSLCKSYAEGHKQTQDDKAVNDGLRHYNTV